MLIDWFTVVAQTINFLILVWLLKRFLYKPILDAIDAREQRIALELADADAAKIEARRERDEFENKNKELDQQRATLIRQMKDETDIQRQKLLEDAHHAADSIATKREEAWQRQQHMLGAEISRRAQEQVLAISRKALKDLADTSLEDRMVNTFARRVRELQGQAKEEIGLAIKDLTEPACVRSVFELTNQQQNEVQRAIDETFGAPIPLRFEFAPDNISGIEVECDGRKIAWSIDEYINGLEKSIANSLEPLKHVDTSNSGLGHKQESRIVDGTNHIGLNNT